MTALWCASEGSLLENLNLLRASPFLYVPGSATGYLSFGCKGRARPGVVEPWELFSYWVEV